MVGQPAVCRRSLQNGAFRHHPVLILVSTPASTDALLCRFSAAVSLQVMRWLSGLFQKLRIRVAEGMTKSEDEISGEISGQWIYSASTCATRETET